MRLPRIEDLLNYAIEDSVLFGGALLKASASSPQWTLLTKAPTSSIALFRRYLSELVVSSDVIGMGEGWTFWVLGYQVRDVQHRVFLPLAGSQVHEMLTSIGQSGLQLTMEMGDLRLTTKVPVADDFLGSMQEQKHAWPDSRSANELFFRTCLELLLPPNLRPAEGTQMPATVSVTAVISCDFPPPQETAALRVFSALQRT